MAAGISGELAKLVFSFRNGTVSLCAFGHSFYALGTNEERSFDLWRTNQSRGYHEPAEYGDYRDGHGREKLVFSIDLGNYCQRGVVGDGLLAVLLYCGEFLYFGL